MARLDSTPPNLIPKLLGSLIERLTFSMENNRTIARENDKKKDSKLDARYTNKELVVIAKGQESTITQYANFLAARTSGKGNPMVKVVKL